MYSTGIVTVTQDSSVVTGAGTAWDSSSFTLANALYFKIYNTEDELGSHVYEIAQITSTTRLILTGPYRGDTGNYFYNIDHEATTNYKIPTVNGKQPEAWLRKALIQMENMIFAYVENV